MNIAVGKYTLESLTSGMYNTSMVLYREYIQNSIDAIDDALDSDILCYEEAKVTIEIDSDNRRIIIEDNGSGIPSKHVENQLLGIGNSNKAILKRRGFRGIGRLVGIGYADRLSFYTSYAGEKTGNIITIDCDKLREILIPGQYENFSLVDALKHVITREEYIEQTDLHYFRVVLDGVESNEQVLDYDEVKDYICQTAPLPYNPDYFSWREQIEQACYDAGYRLVHYSIFIKHPGSDEEQLFKLYSDKFFVSISKQQVDQIKNIYFHQIMDKDDNLIALLWYGQSSYLGTILDDKIKGLRFRKGNMLVGDRTTANLLFREERFNGWFPGEIFVFDKRIIPNARRDDFEQNENYRFLLAELSNIGNDLSREIRKVSSQRNSEKDIYDKILILSNKTPQAVTKYPQINLCSNLSQSQKKLLEKVFEALDDNAVKNNHTLKKAILDKVNRK